MLHATLRKKPGGGDLNTEDAFVATIFERLAYLPPRLAWSLLLSGLKLNDPDQPEVVAAETFSPSFWPVWQHPDGGRVEPDIVLEAKNATLVIEAKRPEEGENHTREQWERELAAARNRGIARPILVALPPPVNLYRFANSSAEFAALHWEALADAVAGAYTRPHSAEQLRVLSDLLLAFRSRGVVPHLPLVQLGADLTAVREASRTLATFHQLQLGWFRSFERVIRDEEPRLKFDLWYSDRHLKLPVPARESPLTHWAWDYLPLVAPVLMWSTGAPAFNSVRVGLSIVLDGWVKRHGEPLAQDLPPADQCSTRVYAWVYRMLDPDGCGDWNAVWRRRQELSHATVDDGTLHEAVLGGLRFGLGAVSCELEDLTTRDEWEERLFGPVRQMLQGHPGRLLEYYNTSRRGLSHQSQAWSCCGQEQYAKSCQPIPGFHPGELWGTGSRRSGGVGCRPTWSCCRRILGSEGCNGVELDDGEEHDGVALGETLDHEFEEDESETDLEGMEEEGMEE